MPVRGRAASARNAYSCSAASSALALPGGAAGCADAGEEVKARRRRSSSWRRQTRQIKKPMSAGGVRGGAEQRPELGRWSQDALRIWNWPLVGWARVREPSPAPNWWETRTGFGGGEGCLGSSARAGIYAAPLGTVQSSRRLRAGGGQNEGGNGDGSEEGTGGAGVRTGPSPTRSGRQGGGEDDARQQIGPPTWTETMRRLGGGERALLSVLRNPGGGREKVDATGIRDGAQNRRSNAPPTNGMTATVEGRRVKGVGLWGGLNSEDDGVDEGLGIGEYRGGSFVSVCVWVGGGTPFAALSSHGGTGLFVTFGFFGGALLHVKLL
jgi:hypothetical protein|uniref:Uncharacterized protein n=1 Tax=Zea mays TaxID=4577 RepID=A0A804RC43_MAIZE